jgi:hypothetical protein
MSADSKWDDSDEAETDRLRGPVQWLLLVGGECLWTIILIAVGWAAAAGGRE